MILRKKIKQKKQFHRANSNIAVRKGIKNYHRLKRCEISTSDRKTNFKSFRRHSPANTGQIFAFRIDKHKICTNFQLTPDFVNSFCSTT